MHINITATVICAKTNNATIIPEKSKVSHIPHGLPEDLSGILSPASISEE
jgi:hypothetical protein